MKEEFREKLHAFFSNRLLVFMVVLCVAFAFDGVRVLYLQTERATELKTKAESQQLYDREVTAMRGTIYDSEGNVLAQSATVWNIFIDPGCIESESEREVLVNGLADIFGYDEKQKLDLYEKSKKDTRYVIVEKKVENAVKEKLAAFRKDNSLGNVLGMEQTEKRYYPYNNFASCVVGFTGDDGNGLMGIEKYYDKELAGTNGRIVTVKDALSRKLPMDYETSVDAMDGNSLVLTINQSIQFYLEKGLRTTMKEYKSKGAYGIVMDCNTGAVLAMCSLPDYDCNKPNDITQKRFISVFEKVVKEEKEKEIEKRKKDGEDYSDIDTSDKANKADARSRAVQNQWRNFTVSDTYVPGSVFKTFMACAALEENVATLDTSYTCTGSIRVGQHTMKCHYRPGHGTENFTQGLENSCNPFFITIGQRLGVHNYFKYFDAFGFTQLTNIDVPGEARSQYYREEQYSIVELSSASFGQTNSLTPIQVCTGLCAIANGGTLVKPYLVSEIKDANGNTVKKFGKTEVRRVISEDTSEKVRTMMKAVVDEGTGKNGYVAGYRVGGKTGTSTKLGESKQGEKDKYIVSFAAIAPSDKPEIAALILIDEPNEDLGGGALCAPIAAQVTEQAMQVLGVEPKYSEDEAKNLSVSTPALIGMSTGEAKSTLDGKNLKYKFVGSGKSVLSQSPGAGSAIPSGGVVVIYTEKNEKSQRKKVAVPDFKGLTISEANATAADKNLNIEISGNNLSSSNVVAYSQSLEKGKKVEEGTVITVSFKSTTSVLD